VLASVINIGCRLNQSEGDSLRRYLESQGYELETGVRGQGSGLRNPTPGPRTPVPELVIVNTCCVTKEAERSSLNRIRRAAALQPKPRLLVTGCFAELARERLRGIPGVDEVLGIEAKEKLIAGMTVLPDRSRAFLKVQDGCPNRCAFCIVSTLRTRLYSKSPTQVRTEARVLLDQGFHELVLVGLNLGMYGADTGNSLACLLDELAGLKGDFRIRLSSLEPDTITRDLQNRIAELCRSGFLCPHLHIPLQSGADRILAAMNRHYTTVRYRNLLERLRPLVPDINIGTDVIVGFPGEDEQSLQTTLALLEVLPLGYLHVFSFSPRPATPASALRDTLGREARKCWVTRLRGLGSTKSIAYRTRFIGTTRIAVPAPQSAGRNSQVVLAVTDNYISVQCGLRNADCEHAPLVRVRIDRVDGERTLGTLVAALPHR
jgi:threonylcarbamoyladenosine tRNA methylthiotransferase MtaB